jgi:phosphatidylserine/phosphatidylglycerophosphate/cardiolipin synthase-like enzyme
MAISVTFLEQAGQTPESIAALLAEFLAAAQTSIHIAIYDFRLDAKLAKPVITALRERAASGVEVRIAFDAGKQSVAFRKAGADPAPVGTSRFVARIGDGVASKAITGGDSPVAMLMHHKYVIRDGRTPAAAVWTGSTNFTADSWSLQENNIVCIDSPELCAFYEHDFDELWTSGDIATTGAHDTGTVSVGTTKVSVSFAPGEGRAIDHDVAACIASARRRIKIASMLLTSGSILGALADALSHNRVAEFGGLYDRTQMESVLDQWHGTPSAWKIGAFTHIARGLAGKPSTPFQARATHDFMHNKMVVADDTVITGSYNFSNSAIENAENVLIVRDASLADRFVDYIDQLVFRYGSEGRELER